MSYGGTSSPFCNSLDGVFSPQSYDNGDAQLDSAELLKFIQQNESVAELQSYADQESNKLLRSVAGAGPWGAFKFWSADFSWSMVNFPWHSVSLRPRGNVYTSPHLRLSSAAIFRSFVLSNSGLRSGETLILSTLVK